MPVETVLEAETPASGKNLRRSLLHMFGENRFFMVLSIVIGILSGTAVVAFRLSIDLVHRYMLGANPSRLRLVLSPTLAGLLVAVLVIHFFPRVRGSGVNQTNAALYVFNGYIPFCTAIGKFLTAALAISSGHSSYRDIFQSPIWGQEYDQTFFHRGNTRQR